MPIKYEHNGVKEEYQVLQAAPDVRSGNYKKYKNGTLVESGFYKNNQKDSIWNIYSQFGKVAEGKYTLNKKEGIWSYYSWKGELVQKYDHSNDSLIYINRKENPETENSLNLSTDTMLKQAPIFIGGTTYMYALIANNMVYPKDAAEDGSSGTAYISFVVDTSGNTTEVKSLRKVGNGFDEEGIRLIELFGKSWIPARKDGKAIKVIFTLPLKFKIL